MGKDLKEAFQWFSRAAQQGDPESQFYLGVMHECGEGVEQDAKRLLNGTCWQPGRNMRRPSTNVGNFYYKGVGTEKDLKKAVKWLTLAAMRGIPQSQNLLGLCCTEGLGMEQDFKEASRWYTLSAQQGLADAQNNLGIHFMSGGSGFLRISRKPSNGFPPLPVRDILLLKIIWEPCMTGVSESGRIGRRRLNYIPWLRQQGYGMAQSNLGKMYETGRGVRQDSKKAFDLYLSAAQQGEADGQNNVGVMYERGMGIPQNLKEAFKWVFRRRPAGKRMGAKQSRSHVLLRSWRSAGSKGGVPMVFSFRRARQFFRSEKSGTPV